MQKIQTFLSQKQNFFFIFLGIFKIYIKLSAFRKTDDPHALCVSEITVPGRCG